MPTKEMKIVQVSCPMNTDLIAEANLEVCTLGLSERLFSAFKYLGIFWLAALFAIFIPVLHFLLTPLAFFLGIFFFYRKLKQPHALREGRISCPSCQTNITLDTATFNWPKSMNCPQCHMRLAINTK